MSRAPGQWWARWRDGDPRWQPFRVREWHYSDHDFERGTLMCDRQGGVPSIRADTPEIEWGDPIPQPAPVPLESGRAILGMSDYEDVRIGEHFRGKTFTQMRASDCPLGRFLRNVVSPALMHQRPRLPTDHADDCACDWCRRLTKDDAAALVARLENLEGAP